MKRLSSGGRCPWPFETAILTLIGPEDSILFVTNLRQGRALRLYSDAICSFYLCRGRKIPVKAARLPASPFRAAHYSPLDTQLLHLGVHVGIEVSICADVDVYTEAQAADQ